MLRKMTDKRRYGIERRDFLRYMAAVSAIPTIALRAEGPVTGRPRFSGNPFTLGVASGDPEPNGVVIWTKLAPKPLDGGGVPNEPMTVQWEVAIALVHVSCPPFLEISHVLIATHFGLLHLCNEVNDATCFNCLLEVHQLCKHPRALGLPNYCIMRVRQNISTFIMCEAFDAITLWCIITQIIVSATRT